MTRVVAVPCRDLLSPTLWRQEKTFRKVVLAVPWFSALSAVENPVVVRSIRNGLVMAIPIVLIGSFALVLQSLPLPAYQAFLEHFASGMLRDILSLVFGATSGILSVYMAVFIGMSHARLQRGVEMHSFGFPAVALACFAILAGSPQRGIAVDVLGVKGMFTAIFAASVSSSLMTYWSKRKWALFRLYSGGADVEFNSAVAVVIPAVFTVAMFGGFSYVFTEVFHFANFNDFFVNMTSRVFSVTARPFLIGLLFVLLSGLMWFFGIHGSNVLEGVAQRFLEPGAAINAALATNGQPPSEIVSKTFIDVFVLMGGCGSTLCLLAALLLFGRDRGNRTLSRIAVVPMLFNINELMVFGFPIVYNVYLFLPFILTPLLVFLISYGAMALGVVPLPIREVGWTTPILIGGYLATDSPMGSVLQLVNLALGILVYKPFIRFCETGKTKNADADMKNLVGVLKKSEETRVPVDLIHIEGHLGLFAKLLATDLKHAMKHGALMLHYQPQYDNRGECVGSEALLRWNHETFGMVYPPLIIHLAEETGTLYELERYVLGMAARNAGVLRGVCGRQLKTCVNITATTFCEETFEQFLRELFEKEEIKPGDLWLELTEQKAFVFDHATEQKSRRIRAMGFPLVIDDFSMGHTSLKYLQRNEFDMVKLDGSLVREINGNSRCNDIVGSIVSLSGALNFIVMGECVETKEEQLSLEQLGCVHYQGYLYSPAVPFEEFLELLRVSRISG